MLTDKKVKISETIHAPAPEVWKALTDKKMIKQYFFGTEAESEWKKGSSITFTGQWEGQEYVDKGTILDIVKEKRLSFAYWSSMSGLEDKPENYATVTYVIEPGNGQTNLTVTQEGFKDEQAYEHSVSGWQKVLKNLKALVEE
ncbi:MAG: SRPBCC family protein [Balneolaceae bacterium]